MASAVKLLSATVIILVVIFNPFSQAWYAGMVYGANFRQAEADAYVAANYKTLCANYFKASWIERWTSSHFRKKGYCEDYREKMGY